MNKTISSNLQVTGCRFIKKQLSVLARHLEGVKTGEGIEDVHQARVACRRIRSAFSFFSECFDQEQHRIWTQHVKKLMKSLGMERDLDVQIEFLKKVQADIDSDHKKIRPGIQRMSLRWRQHRDTAHAKVVKAIEKIQKKHILTDIHLEAERIIFECKGSPSNLTPSVILDRIYQKLDGRVADFLRRKPCLERPEDSAGHHVLRISAKHLRYEMEISDLVLRGELKNTIKKIKKVQTILGELHDCVVWESDICDFIEQEKQRTIDYYGHDRPFARILPGLEFLRQERQDYHDKLFIEARNYITQLDQENFWTIFLEQLRTDNTSETDASEANIDEEKKNTQIAPDNRGSV